MITLNTLPINHGLRNKPLKAARYRRWQWRGEDITVPFDERGEGWRHWGVMKMWQSPASVLFDKSFNDLGPVWAECTDWTFDEPTDETPCIWPARAVEIKRLKVTRGERYGEPSCFTTPGEYEQLSNP